MLSRVRLAAAASLLLLSGIAAAAVAAGTAKVTEQKVSEQKVPEAAPRAAQIEPLVAPVKRVVPKVSETKEKPAAKATKTAKKTGGGTDKAKIKKAGARANNSRAATAVASKAQKDDCAKGFKLNDTGSKCVKLAASAGAKTAKVKTAAAKKKHR